MIKDLNISKFIISEDDPRYGKIGHLMKKYPWESLYKGEDRSMYYFIPFELVLTEYNSGSILVTNKDTDWEWTNWVNRQSISRVLKYTCNLTTQDYFDLFQLNINNKFDRPRCTYCKSELEWSGRLMRGYNRSTPWNTDANHFCDHYCQMNYIWENRELYEHTGYITTSWVRGRELTRHSDSETCYFYICISDGYIKYGLTVNPNFRSRFVTDKGLHIILVSNFREILALETSIKLKFNGREYIEYSELHKLIMLLKSLLKNRPIKDPLE